MARRKQNKPASGVAVIYARYSSNNQREVSIDQQVNMATDFASREGLSIAEVYADKALTGKNDQRPAFQRMMKDAEQGKFSYVISWKSSRIGRNMLEAMMNEVKLTDMGVKCLYVEEDFDDSAAGRFALRNMMNVNQFYSEALAEDVKRGLMFNASKCMLNGSPPLGYKKGEGGRYAIDEPKAEIVREIFERVNRGEAYIDIANDLNARGYKTSKGNPWNKGSFTIMLRNERYIGVYKYNEVRIEDGIPPIIKKELFYSVQDKLNNRQAIKGRKSANGEYLLTGKLFCGHCGHPMIGISGTSKTGELHFYYNCKNRKDNHACDKKHVRRDDIEHLVAESVQKYIMREDVIEWIIAGCERWTEQCRKESALYALTDELAAINKSIKNIMNAIEAGVITATTRDRLLELEADKKRTEIAIAAEREAQREIDPDKIRFIIHELQNGNIKSKKYQKKLIDIFVQAVYLYDDHFKIVFNFSGTENSVDIGLAEVSDDDLDSMADCSFKLPSAVPIKKRRVISHVAFWLFVVIDDRSERSGYKYTIYEKEK